MVLPKQRPSGRYEGVRRAVSVQHYPSVPLNVRTGLAAVPDTDGRSDRPIQAFVRLNILEDYLSHKRIDAAQFDAGRRLADAWEQLTRLKGSSIWKVTGRVDGGRGDAEIGMLARAGKSRDTIASAKKEIGEQGIGFLKSVLVDGRTLGELARRPGERARTAAGNIFCWHLEELANAWAAKGPDHARMRSSRGDNP